jgi:uncharacterized protein YjiS (DUF1127 family)
LKTYSSEALSLHIRRSGHGKTHAHLWDAVVIRWTRWRREREINRKVAVLADLDDRTLRDIGVPDRSLIRHAARCRRNLWI